MTDDAKAAEAVKALQLETREHKSELQRHRRALRAKMKRIAELKKFCQDSGIGLTINGEGG